MRYASLGSILVLVLMGHWTSADDWNQFRGPNASGVLTESSPLPTKFSFEDKVLWSAELGTGIACPVISNGRAIATTMTAKETFAVVCLDAITGKELWRREFPTGKLPPITSPNTHASSTPTADGQRAYVYFSTLGLMAFDLKNGRTVWKHKTQQPYYLLGWGAAASPIIYKDMLIYCQDDDRDPFLMALDRKTGDVRWKTPRTEMLAGYAVPVICKANGQEDIVIAGSGKLKGYDPKTGKERWSCDSLLRTIMTTPVVLGDRIYVSVQSYGDTDRVLKYALLQWKDTNQDGKLDKKEIGKPFWAKFDRGDANKDGFLVDKEIDLAFQATTNMAGGGNIIQSIRGGGKGNVTRSHLLWNLSHKAPSNIASPLVFDGRLFVVKKGGISASFDVKSGKTVWQKKRIRNLGNYYASPIAGDGKIYVMGENGFLVVLKKGPKMKVLAKNDMGESCIATPAISNGRIYVRTLTKMYCFSDEAK